MLPNFLSPYLTYLKFFAIAAVFVMGFALASHLKQGTIDKLNQDIGEYKSAYSSLALTTQEQNNAISDLQDQAAAREKAAAAAIQEAHNNTQVIERKVTALLHQRPANGKNVCEAARQAFDEELRQERGVK